MAAFEAPDHPAGLFADSTSTIIVPLEHKMNEPMVAKKRVLITGGGTFLGDAIAAALLAEGADVTLLVRAGAEGKLGGLAQRARVQIADLWEPSSLKGRARGIQTVVHTVGSMTADPSRGLTYHWLNFVSARNVANMCVSGGVPHMVLMSSSRAPWIPNEYLRAKYEAEEYLIRIGLKATIIRAPIAYLRGEPRKPLYRLASLFGNIPPFSWLGLRRMAPLPVDVIARGVARITLNPRQTKPIYAASDLRAHNTGREIRKGISLTAPDMLDPTHPVEPIELLGDEIPFGWTPPGSS